MGSDPVRYRGTHAPALLRASARCMGDARMQRAISLNFRMMALMGAFAVLTIGIAGLTYWVTNAQKTDGAIINVAGRQRMLSQQISKAALAYAGELRKGENADAETLRMSKEEASAAKMLLQKTHDALRNGGQLQVDNEDVLIPPCRNEEIFAQFETVNGVWRPFSSSIDVILSAKSTMDGGFEQAVAQVSKQNIPLLKELNASVSMFQANLDKRGALMRNVQYATCTAALLLAILGAWFVNARITKPINSIVARLAAGVAEVNTTSAQVAETSEKMASGASDQAAAVEETSSTTEEIAAGTRANAASARQANELSVQARGAAESGDATMAQLNDAMVGINSSAEQISRIIKVIEEIAFQTNLLALNAAVEAARAGEQGKGFAVVAEEVRRLAQRAAQAAGETTILIEDSVQKARQGTTVAGEVAEMLTTIVTDVTKVSDLIDTIANATQEQTQGVDQVNVALSQIDRVTQDSAAGAAASAKSAKRLTGHAEGVRRTVLDLVSIVGGQAELDYRP